MWTNVGLVSWKNKSAETFTSVNGIKSRRKLFPVTNWIVSKAARKGGLRIIIEKWPDIPNDENVIFAAGHSFPGEVASNLAAVDRSTYVVVGTTDHLDHNPEMYFAWMNGLIYVNRLDQKSRTDCQLKMEKVLNNGSSVLLYPEGTLNNSENSLCLHLYTGIYYVAKNTGKRVVPMLSEKPYGSKNIYVLAGEPIDFSNLDRDEALTILRDQIATLRWNAISRETHKRSDLSGDIHLSYMIERKNVYYEVKWTRDCFDEEITPRIPKGDTTPQLVRASFDNVKIDFKNAGIMAPIIVNREYDKKYDFLRFMHEQFEK